MLNNLLSVFDLEKLSIPPQLDRGQGLYGNQILCERALLDELDLDAPAASHLLDMGCGRGRIENAIDRAAECGMSDRLHHQVGNHHEPLAYESGSFDGCYSFQAVWPFFEIDELDAHAEEKSGGESWTQAEKAKIADLNGRIVAEKPTHEPA